MLDLFPNDATEPINFNRFFFQNNKITGDNITSSNYWVVLRDNTEITDIVATGNSGTGFSNNRFFAEFGTHTWSGTEIFRDNYEAKAYTVATTPSAAIAGQTIYVTDGAAGSPIVAFSDGTNWKRTDTAATIAAS
jgi:hypothetical protein